LASRVDIRVLKKQLKQKKSKAAAAAAQVQDLKTALAAQNKSIVHHLLEKLQKTGEKTVVTDDDDEDDADADVGTKPEDGPDVKDEVEDDDDVDQEEEEVKSGALVDQGDAEVDINEPSQSPVDEDADDDSVSDDDDEDMKQEGAPETNREPPKEELVHNRWSKRVRVNNDFNDDKPFVSDDFKVAFEERKRKQKEGGLLNGWEECDIADCFCKEEPLGLCESFDLTSRSLGLIRIHYSAALAF